MGVMTIRCSPAIVRGTSSKVTKSEKTEIGSEEKAFIVGEQGSESERVEVVEAGEKR